MELNEIFRQARESLIIVNAHKINQGQMPSLKIKGEKLRDFYFIEQDEPEKVLTTILELVKTRIPKAFGLDPFDDIQVLTPMHKGDVGAGNLNIELQNALNPDADSLTRGGKIFRINDKVMQIQNNYDKEVFNGDLGRVTNIDFDGTQVGYDYSDLDELVPAYAISIHKSQGSEYPAVVIPILIQHYVLLQRNLIYTAVTRGKKLVVIVGSKKPWPSRAATGRFNFPLKVVDGLKTTTCRFCKIRLWPVWGLRPRLLPFRRTTNLPKPLISTSSPPIRVSLMISMTASTKCRASLAETP